MYRLYYAYMYRYVMVTDSQFPSKMFDGVWSCVTNMFDQTMFDEQAQTLFDHTKFDCVS